MKNYSKRSKVKQRETGKQHVWVYCDESRQVQSRYMLIGGIWIPKEVESDFLFACAEYRARMNMTAELKWTKVSRAKLDAYKQFVDLFFQNRGMRFRCIVIDTHKADYRQNHAGDREASFYQFYSLFLSHNMEADREKGEFLPDIEYRIITHRFQNRKAGRLDDLKRHLNSGGFNVRAVEAREAKGCIPFKWLMFFWGLLAMDWKGIIQVLLRWKC